jgi:7-cyano-7-deazaguanine synthase in queuosine biosynthesis
MFHILLNSGGMDTLLLAHLISRRYGDSAEVMSVFADYDQRYQQKEWVSAQLIAGQYDHPIVATACAPIAQYEHSTGIVPFRNAELLLAAAQFGREDYTNVLYMGVLAHEVNSDKSRQFLWHMEYAMNISHKAQYWTAGKIYRISTPMRCLTKTEAVRDYLAHSGDEDLLLATVSCYSDTLTPCGHCSSCFKRWVALANNGLTQHFLQDPWDLYTPRDLQEKMRGYHSKRADEIRDAYLTLGIVL